MMKINLLLSAFLLTFCFSVFSAQENYKTLVHKGNAQFDKENYESASAKYMEALQLDSKDFMAHYNLGNALYKQKKYDEAQAEFEKAEDLATTLSDKSAALYNLGNTHMQKQNSKKAAELYKKALKQDPYNETIRKNYEIAMLQEKQKQEEQKNGQSGDDGKNQKQNKGDQKGDQPKNESGTGQQNKGEGEGKEQNENKNSPNNQMPKDVEKAILDRVGNKERETAQRILNKNSYSMPQSNEKDW